MYKKTCFYKQDSELEKTVLFSSFLIRGKRNPSLPRLFDNSFNYGLIVVLQKTTTQSLSFAIRSSLQFALILDGSRIVPLPNVLNQTSIIKEKGKIYDNIKI